MVYLTAFFHYKNYTSFLKGGGDAWGYYVYLPATFIYHDLDNLQQTIGKRAEYHSQSIKKQENGYLQIEEAHAYRANTIIKYTYGVAFLNTPFFFFANLFCKITNYYPADGYSLPYNLIIGFGTLLFSLFGLWLIRKMLMDYFSDIVTAIVLAAIGLGTNLYFFATSNLGMSHPYLFVLFALCLYATDKFYKTNKMKDAVLIGFSCGMVTVIRPNEIIICLFPLLWNVFSWDTFKVRIKSFVLNWKKFAIAILIFMACLTPQILYWKVLTGKLFFYSYTGESFNFLHPHIKNGLFGFANGWLAYTPIMFFAVLGLFFLPKYFKLTAAASYIFLPIFVYVIYSWWCWQYINGFGSRPMIDTYPVWAFPFAAMLVPILANPFLKIFSYAIIAFFIFLNLFQTWQFNEGWIWTEDSNWAYYKAIFLKTSSSYEAHVAYDCGETQPDTTKLQQIKILQTLTFDDTTANSVNYNINDTTEKAISIKSGFSPTIHFTADNIEAAPQDYFKISCRVYCPELEYDHYKQAILTTEFKRNGKSMRWRSVRLQTKIGNSTHKIMDIGEAHQWQEVWFFVKIPKCFKTKSDELNVMVWNLSETPIYIDNLQVEWWKRK